MFARSCNSGLRSCRYRKATSASCAYRGFKCQLSRTRPYHSFFPRVRRLIRLAHSDRKYQCFHVPTFFRVSPPMSPPTAAVTSLRGVNVEPRRRETDQHTAPRHLAFPVNHPSLMCTKSVSKADCCSFVPGFNMMYFNKICAKRARLNNDREMFFAIFLRNFSEADL